MNRLLLLCGTVITLTSWSCSKDSGGNDDREPPVILMNTPTNNQVFAAGQQVQISGTITDNNYLKEIHLEIHDLTSTQELLHQHIHPGGASYALNYNFTVAAATNYEIRVIAEDPAGQLTQTKLSIAGN